MPGGKAKNFTGSGINAANTSYPGKQNALILHGEFSLIFRNIMIEICQLAANNVCLNTKRMRESGSKPLDLYNAECCTEALETSLLCDKDKPVNKEADLRSHRQGLLRF